MTGTFFRVGRHCRTQTLGHLEFARAHVVKTVLVVGLGVYYPVTKREKWGLDFATVLFSCWLVLDVRAARVCPDRIGYVVTFFTSLPFVGKRNHRLLDIVFRSEKIVLLVVVEGSA